MNLRTVARVTLHHTLVALRRRVVGTLLLLLAFVASTHAQDVGFGNALSFNGVNQFVRVPQPFIPTNGEFTIEFWVNATVSTGTFREIVSQGQAAVAPRFYLGIEPGGTIRAGDNWSVTGVALPSNSWHHLALSRTAGNAFLYLNGALAATKGSVLSNASTAPFADIGQQFQNGGEFWLGGIDDVRVWNTARSQAQIRATMNRAVAGNESNLVAYYRFDAGSGTVAANSATATGPALNGSLSNAPAWIPSGAVFSLFADATTNVLDGVTNATAGSVFVGSNSPTTLLLTNGAVLANLGDGVIGFTTNAAGSRVTVTGAGSVWSNSGSLFVGLSGSANTLVVSNGARVAAQLGFIGNADGASNNQAVVTGIGSRLELNVFLSVGANGAGRSNSLLVSNGGVVSNAGIGYIGFLSTNSSATVTGAGSLWTNGSEMRVGESGAGNGLLIANAGRVDNTTGTIGLNSGASNNQVTVRGNGSLWNNSSALVVGNAGSFNSLILTNGGTVVNTIGTIGLAASANGNQVIVSGSGSLWSSSGELLVGNAGSGNLLLVTNGGDVVNSGLASIGRAAGANENQVRVTGAGSTWTNLGSWIDIGDSGSANSLIISNGGQVFGNSGYVSTFSSASSNLVAVAGNNSLWQNNADTFIGFQGSSATLLISNGGVVVNHNGYVGFTSGSSNNQVIVSGTGSVWSNNAGVLVGASGSGNTLLIADGGAVHAASAFVGANFGSTNNVLQLANGSLTAPGGLTINEHNALTGSGTIAANVTSSGGIAPRNSAGSLHIDGSLTLTASAGMHFDIGGLMPTNQYDRVTVTSLVDFAGTLSLTLIDGFIPAPTDSFTLMTFGAASGAFGNAAPNTFLATTDQSYRFQVSYSDTSLVLSNAQAVPNTAFALKSPATLPDLLLSSGGLVKAIVQQPDGKVIIGGTFSAVNNIPRTNLARLNPNGSLDMTWNPPPPRLQGVFGGNGGVDALALVGTDLYVGGWFDRVGSENRSGLAKFSTVGVGELDLAWNGNASLARALTVVGPWLYVAANSVAGQSHLARVSLTTGERDASWNPNPITFQNVEATFLLALATDGTDVFVGGELTSIGGQARNFVAKLTAAGNGAADPAWNPAIQHVLPYSAVRAMTFDGTNLFLGGQFTGIGTNAAQLNAAKVSPAGTGAVDYSWRPNPLTSYYGNDASSTVGLFALGVTNGQVYFGGEFDRVDGQAIATTLAKVSSSDGTLDTNWHPLPDGRFIKALVPTESSVLVGGNFNRIDGAVSLAIARLSRLDGALDSAFPANVQSPGEVRAIVRQPDGRLIVGGQFYFAGGLPRQHLVRVNRDGSVDATWAPTAVTPTFFNGAGVLALALGGNDLFVGGLFTNVSGLPRRGLAKIATVGSDAVDTNWIPDLLGTFNNVTTMAIDGTNLFVGGSGFVARFPTTGTGGANLQWALSGGSAGARAFALALSGTNLFVGGDFTTIAGVPRNGIAKLSTVAPATVDPVWDPGAIYSAGAQFPYISSLVTDGSNVFVGGFSFAGDSFTNIGGQAVANLAKLSASGTGLADASWTPNLTTNLSVSRLTALAYDGETNLYVAGIDAFNVPKLARVSTVGVGAADPAFDPQPREAAIFAQVLAMLPVGRGVYVGGQFRQIGGAIRESFAFLPSPGASLVFQDTLTDLHVTRSNDDGPEVTHFRINDIYGGALYRKDGVTPLGIGDFVTATEAAAGLKFSVGGTVIIAPALNPTLDGVATVATTYTMSTSLPPVFALSADSYSVREGDGSVAVIVRKFGGEAAQVDYATAAITAQANVDYLERSGRLSFAAADKAKTVFVPIADDFLPGTDKTFSFTLTPVPGPNPAQIVSPMRAIVTLADNDVTGSDSFATNQNPAALPPAHGSLIVDLDPPAALGQWRLLGEMSWRDSGAQVNGLVSANYGIEFRPVTGYRQPERLTVPINGGSPEAPVTNQLTLFYAAIASPEAGSLSVTLKPDDVATNANVNLRGQWRRQGTTNWLNSGEVVLGLNAGNYTVEFKSVPGLTPPAAQLIEVGPNATYGSVGTYLLGELAGAQLPIVVPSALAASNAPYVHNGQIQSSVGFSSGFVVKERVVLTCAHALFDDNVLSYSTEARWFHQRYRGEFEPPAQTPRGWYIFEGYAFQRQQDNSPGVSTPASQNLDVAAMYFLEPAGRGGFGGYLASDPAASELLGGANKMLVGYPLEGVPEADQGKLHATPLTNLTFVRLYTGVFATTNIFSSPGNSGGPLYIQTGPTNFFPAGIFLGGSGQTLVRGIDSDVVDLINRAETSGNGGGNSTGGGVTLLVPGLTIPPFGTGLLTVNLGNAGTQGGGWRISQNTDTNFIINAAATVALISGGNYTLEFRPAPGLVAPTNRTIRVALNQTVTVDGSYLSPGPLAAWQTTNFGGNATNALIGGPGADPDGDGVVNLLEYALGTDPNLPSAGALPTASLTNIAGTNYLFLRFTRVTNNTDLTYAVLVGGTPTNYVTGSVYSAALTIGTNAFTTQIGRSGTPVETILVRDNTPAGTVTNRFMRLQVSTP